MFNLFNQKNSVESNIYNKIVLLSRNKIFYTNFDLRDTFQNRIMLIFIHISFLNIKTKQNNLAKTHSELYQNMFEFMFKKIDQNMREIGYGDVTVSKNMKYLITTFYNILLKCENYRKKKDEDKNAFFIDYLDQNNKKNNSVNPLLVEYFNRFEAFCFDLSSDSVLKGVINFNYK